MGGGLVLTVCMCCAWLIIIYSIPEVCVPSVIPGNMSVRLLKEEASCPIGEPGKPVEVGKSYLAVSSLFVRYFVTASPVMFVPSCTWPVLLVTVFV